MRTAESRSETGYFLGILDILSFDDHLFRKEFIKTLTWVPRNEYPGVLKWFHQMGYSLRYPELLMKFEE